MLRNGWLLGHSDGRVGELPHDRIGGSRSREDADPGREVEAGNELRHRRHIGHLGRTPGAVAGDQGDLPGLNATAEGRIGREQRVDVPAQQRRHRFARAAERHMGHVELELRLDRFHGEVMRGADAGRSVVDLARVGPCIVDELLHGLDRQLGMHGQEQRGMREQRDRHEIMRLIRQLLVDEGIDRQERIVGDDELIAVGRRRHQCDGGDGAAAPRPVLDHDGLLEPFLQARRNDASHGVGQSAGRERHDELDDPGRKFVLRPRRRCSRQKERQQRGKCAQREPSRPAEQSHLEDPPGCFLARNKRLRASYRMTDPPSTAMVWPVTKSLSSDAR